MAGSNICDRVPVDMYSIARVLQAEKDNLIGIGGAFIDDESGY